MIIPLKHETYKIKRKHDFINRSLRYFYTKYPKIQLKIDLSGRSIIYYSIIKNIKFVQIPFVYSILKLKRLLGSYECKLISNQIFIAKSINNADLTVIISSPFAILGIVKSIAVGLKIA